MVYIGNSKENEVLKLDVLNTVIQDEETIKEIIRRLKENKDYIFLIDAFDNSPIVIDDKLHDIILNYFEDKLLALQIRRLSNG